MPTTMSCQNGLMPAMIMAFCSSAMSSTPRNAPRIVPTPPDKAGAAEDHGRDHLELDALPGEHHGGVEPRGEQRAGKPGEKAHDDEEDEHRAIDIDAGQLGGAGIAADVVGLAEIARASDQKREDQHDDGHEPERRIDAEDLGLAEDRVAIADIGDAGARDELQPAAIDRQRGKRRDQRVDLEAW